MPLIAFPAIRCLPVLVALVAATPVLAADASPWSTSKGASVRLIPGSAGEAATRRAGLEIKLDGKWKTYWRYPGDSGVPPMFDWSKSTNLDGITIDWPAPQRFDDEGGTTIGYTRGVVLPLTIRPKDPQQPVKLDLAFDYAICETICVPAKAALALTLDPGAKADTAFDDAIAGAQATVPVSVAVGASGPLAIRSLTLDTGSKPAKLTIETAADQPVDLFAEGPENWYLPVPQKGATPGTFVLPLEGLPKGATLSGTTLHLTLSTGSGGVETAYTLP